MSSNIAARNFRRLLHQRASKERAASPIPYDLYIHLDQLRSAWQEGASRGEQLLRCGLIATELGLRLLPDALRRAEAPPGRNRGSKLLDPLLRGIEDQLALLHRIELGNAFTTREKSDTPDRSENLAHLASLGRDRAADFDRIHQQYRALARKIGVGLGIEAQLRELREGLGLPALPALEDPTARELDYQGSIRPRELAELHDPTFFNSEDELFVTVHQITECWLQIALRESDRIHSSFEADEPDFERCFPAFDAVCEILDYISRHVGLLENLVLADYHPLRVALRGASGGQSQQAHRLFGMARAIYGRFLEILNRQELAILDILEKPECHAAEAAVIDHLTGLEKALRNFFFRHFLLSAGVIGSRSLGSVGKQVTTLADRFVEPLFPELDQAKYDFTLRTNFEYGRFAGILILQKEGIRESAETAMDAPSPGIDGELAERLVNSYFEAIGRLDGEAWVELFEPDGSIEDPVGSRPYRGRRELSVFFAGVQRAFTAIEMTLVSTRFTGAHDTANADAGSGANGAGRVDTAEVAWQAKAISYNQKELAFHGKETFLFSSEGKIAAARVDWDPAMVAAQL